MQDRRRYCEAAKMEVLELQGCLRQQYERPYIRLTSHQDHDQHRWYGAISMGATKECPGHLSTSYLLAALDDGYRRHACIAVHVLRYDAVVSRTLTIRTKVP